MIKTVLSAALLLILGSTSLAFAETKTFSDFSIEVPENCTAIEKDRMVTVSCSDETFFALALRAPMPQKGRAAADELARAYKGNTPMLNDYGNYAFTTQVNGTPMKVEIIEQDSMLMLYMSDANPNGWPEALSKAFDSISGNTPAVDDFVKQRLLSAPGEPQ